MTTETETDTTVVTVVAPRYSIVTLADLLEGNTPKRSYILERLAAGVEKRAALDEYSEALTERNKQYTVTAGALLGSGDFTCSRMRKTKAGDISLTLKDNRASKAKQALAIAKGVEKLREKLATAEAKLAKLAK